MSARHTSSGKRSSGVRWTREVLTCKLTGVCVCPCIHMLVWHLCVTVPFTEVFHSLSTSLHSVIVLNVHLIWFLHYRATVENDTSSYKISPEAANNVLSKVIICAVV